MTEMDLKRWQQIDRLLEEVLDREPGQREAFLEGACAGDEELRKKVEALLAAHEKAGDFAEVPALDLAARAMAEQQGHSLVGMRLGPYEILSLLGRGGMGEVYRACDARLDRIDALKILPTEVAADPDRLRRFIREAKAASALNHPNIATIYEIGESEGIHWIAMELVEGETLAERLKVSSLEVTEILDIGIQVSEALEKAHSKGIIHRDIKPANVMLTPEGQSKVLDFGLAKVTRPEGRAAATTVSSETHTVPGMVMGTARYMSPEQVLGQSVDHRTDIFSLGAVLYEMAVGQPPFAGETPSVTFDAIVHQTPAWPPRVCATMPEEMRRIVHKSLEKFREMRYQSASDLCAELKRLKRDLELERLAARQTKTSSRAADTIPSRRQRWKWVVAGLLALCLAIASILWYANRRTAQPPVEVLSAVPLTSYPGIEKEPSFSPDGNQVAFSWNGEKEDNFDIYVKLVGAEPPLRLTTNPAPERSPAWAPNGRWIAFMRSLPGRKAAVVLISPIGGPERSLTEMYSNYDEVDAQFLAWTPDSHWLAIVGSDKLGEQPALFLRSVETDEQHKISALPAGSRGDSCPAFSPDGHIMAFFRWATWSNSDLHLLELSADFKPIREPRQLTFGNWSAASPAWTMDGKSLIFSASSNLWRVDATGTGKPQRLASIGRDGTYPAISRHGNRFAYAQATSDVNIYRIELPSPQAKANPPQKLIASTRNEAGMQFSPDGKKISFFSDRSGKTEIWVCEADGSNPVQLTFLRGASIGYTPRWSPDSRRLTFDANIEGHMEVYVVDAGGGSPQRLTSSAYSGNPSWSKNGWWILFDSQTPAPGIYRVPAEGGPAVLVTDKTTGWGPIESQDGKFIYGIGGSAEGMTLLMTPTEGGDVQQVLGSLVNFEVVDDGIYFIPRPDPAKGYSIQFLETATGRTRKVVELGNPRGISYLAVSPDRRWALYTEQDQAGSDLMLVENFR